MDGTDILIIMLICFFVLIIGVFVISNYNIKLVEKYTDGASSCSIVDKVGREYGGTYCDGLTANTEHIYSVDPEDSREASEIKLRNKLQEECNKNPLCKGFTTFTDNQYTINGIWKDNWFLTNYLKNKVGDEVAIRRKWDSDFRSSRKKDTHERNPFYHRPIGKLCIDGWGGSLRNHPEFGDKVYDNDNNEFEPPEGYKVYLQQFEDSPHHTDDKPRYKMRLPDGSLSYANLRTYRCQDKCPAGQGVQSTTPEEKAVYGDFKCKECPADHYSLSHEKECSPCNSQLCPAGTVMKQCDPKTGGVVCGPPETGREPLPP
tara:strand:- start:254 stop:1204 length:951 start_codon:yes stop_codon:yes gene_type:complete